MDIRCRKTICKYNNKYTCTAKGINIDCKCICETYIKTDKKVKDTSLSMFETAIEYAPIRDSKTIDIECKADCLFNKKGKCIANGITVNSLDEKPYCITYLKK